MLQEASFSRDPTGSALVHAPRWVAAKRGRSLGSLFFDQNIDRGKRFVVAVGVFGLHAEELAAGLADGERLSGAHPAFGFGVRRKSAWCRDDVACVVYSLLLSYSLSYT